MIEKSNMTESPFQVRGALEGFYGTFYTSPQRNDLIRFLGRHGFNLYLYGPKNDRHHRRYWRDPYPLQRMQQFAETAAMAREVGVEFGFALSPGQTISYGSEADFELLTAKLCAFYEIGVRVFSLFLDDIIPKFNDDADTLRYENYAAAQADLCNRTFAWLRELDTSCALSMCPTDYHGVPPFGDYLYELGDRLESGIDIFYTGPKICSTSITASDAGAFAAAVHRRPLIWDNYPVNDLAMQSEMHIGPIRGRDPCLHENVRGIVVNLMLQPEASKVPLHTFAAYFGDPDGYDAESAWESALHEVAGEYSAEFVLRLGENSLGGCLRLPEAEKLERLARAVLEDAERGVEPGNKAFQALEAYLLQLDAACYHLNYSMVNLDLRQDLLPWTEGLNLQQDMGLRALDVLRAPEPPASTEWSVARLQELVEEVTVHPKRIGGKALLPLAHYALARALALEKVVTM